MATFQKFQPFAADLANGVHNLASDQLVIALTNTAPTNTNGQLSQISEISYTNLSSRNITTTSSTQTSGTYRLIVEDIVLTASGSVGPFRYVVIYNDTATNDRLVGFYDYGTSISLAASETFTVDFDGTNGVFSLA